MNFSILRWAIYCYSLAMSAVLSIIESDALIVKFVLILFPCSTFVPSLLDCFADRVASKQSHFHTSVLYSWALRARNPDDAVSLCHSNCEYKCLSVAQFVMFWIVLYLALPFPFYARFIMQQLVSFLFSWEHSIAIPWWALFKCLIVHLDAAETFWAYHTTFLGSRQYISESVKVIWRMNIFHKK